MFEETKPNSSFTKDSDGELEDIFVQPEKEIFKPSEEGPNESFDFEEKKFRGKKIITIIIGLLVVGGLVYGGYLGYGKIQQFMKTKEKKSTITPEINQQQKVLEIEIPAFPKDTDGDGLTDKEEIVLGTDLSKADTDGDGLSDREEEDVYKTNPLKPDTDGDGYLDGQEVKYNYDPLNPAKGAMLRDLKAEIEKLNQ